MMVEFFCPTCGATIEVTEDLLPLRCCRRYYPTLESLPTKTTTGMLVVVRCEKCGHRRRIPEGTDTPCPVCSPPAVFDGVLFPAGPGTEFKKLLDELKIAKKKDCNCESILNWMNHMSVDKCRNFFEEVLIKLEENAKKYGWRDKLHAGWQIAKSNLRFKIDPRDPIRGLLTEAINRAELSLSQSQCEVRPGE